MPYLGEEIARSISGFAVNRGFTVQGFNVYIPVSTQLMLNMNLCTFVIILVILSACSAGELGKYFKIQWSLSLL